MIKKISIKNIQSHKNSVLEFDEGINAIVGSSNNGKSAILRALYWVVYNRPLGIDNLLSFWATDKKGNQIEPMSVLVENDRGIITRFRSKDKNQYIINDEELNVVKTDVPEQVENLLSLSDTNIQKQQDAPFLLSLSSGQIAQYFNKIVRLDIIDRVLSNAENQRRKTNQEIKTNLELKSEFESKCEKYFWLDSVEKFILKYEKISKKYDDLKEQVDLLDEQIELYQKYSDIQKKYGFISDANKKALEIKKLNEKTEYMVYKINSISSDLDRYENCKRKGYDFSQPKKIIDEIKKLNNQKVSDEINFIQEKINLFEYAKGFIKSQNEYIVGLKKQLPEICPICGSKMRDGKCVKE